MFKFKDNAECFIPQIQKIWLLKLLVSKNDNYDLPSLFTYVIPFRKTKIKREVIGIKALYKPRSGGVYVAWCQFSNWEFPQKILTKKWQEEKNIWKFMSFGLL